MPYPPMPPPITPKTPKDIPRPAIPRKLNLRDELKLLEENLLARLGADNDERFRKFAEDNQRLAEENSELKVANKMLMEKVEELLAALKNLSTLSTPPPLETFPDDASEGSVNVDDDYEVTDDDDDECDELDELDNQSGEILILSDSILVSCWRILPESPRKGSG